jgi:hypothetical protein
MLNDEHVIMLGNNFFISTQFLIDSALEHAGDKEIEIIGVLQGSCHLFCVNLCGN